MIWRILLGIATFLTIALRRVLRRQVPLNEALYSKTVAIDHIQTGIAWVRGDATIGSVNPSFAQTYRVEPARLLSREWVQLFAANDQSRVREAYSRMMLGGMVSFDAVGERADASLAWLNVRLVPVHDHLTRFVGHHCMIEDQTREHDLIDQVRVLNASVAELQAAAEREDAADSLDALKRATGKSVISVLDNARTAALRESESTTTVVR
jgi:PAS domain S-box-containing protein